MHYLYYARFISHDGKVLYKIGITKSLDTRFSWEPLVFEIILSKTFKNKERALIKEKELLQKHAMDKHNGKPLKSGNTEVFNRNVLLTKAGKYSFDAPRNPKNHSRGGSSVSVRF